HGTGAINVDACRITTAQGDDLFRQRKAGPGAFGLINDDGWIPPLEHTTPPESGRWPANVLLDQHAATWVDEQSGMSVATRTAVSDGRGAEGSHIFSSASLGRHDPGNSYADQGGASRFFYTAKAPKSERPNVDGVQHPTVKPLAIMRWLIRLVTPPNGTILDPFAGSGTTLEAARNAGFSSIGIEAEETYLPLIDQRLQR